MHTIYLITNRVNGKVYVGRTSKTAHERWKYHYWSANKKDYFHYAIRKYGREAFEVSTLAEVETEMEAVNLEQLWIISLRSSEKEFGYNSTLGGDGGEIPNEATRQKIGDASRKRRHSTATRQKMSAAHSGEKNHFFGKQHSPETIEAMKEKCRVALSGENNPWFGKKLSPEHKLKISLAKRGKPRSKTADVAQTAERLSCKEDVAGAIPAFGSSVEALANLTTM